MLINANEAKERMNKIKEKYSKLEEFVNKEIIKASELGLSYVEISLGSIDYNPTISNLLIDNLKKLGYKTNTRMKEIDDKTDEFFLTISWR